MTGTPVRHSKYERHAQRIFCDVFRRKNPTVADRERLEFEIDKIVQTETYGLRADLERERNLTTRLRRLLSEAGYTGQIDVEEPKRPRLRAMAERAKA